MGLGIIAIGLVIGFEAATIKVGPLYAKVGPASFLWFAGGLLILCGVVVAVKSRNAIANSNTGTARPGHNSSGARGVHFLV